MIAMTPAPRFEARRTRTGRVVAVGAPMELADALGGTVELVAPDGAQTATARLVGIGRIWTDPDGRELAYGYVDATTLSAAGAA